MPTPMTAIDPIRIWCKSVDVEPDGLATVRDVLSALEAGVPVPERAARHLTQALRRYLDGEHDITANLGLRPGKGRRHESPLNRERLQRRDDLIRKILAGMVGVNSRSADALAALLRGNDLAFSIIDGKHGWVPLAGQLIREHDQKLSARQILRIAKGEPAYNKQRRKMT